MVGIILALCAFVSIQQKRISTIKEERDIQLHNKDVLLGEANYRYTVLDSLSAISARELILTQRDFEQYRSEVSAIISELEVDRKKLQNVTTMQAQTIYELQNLPARVEVDTVYMVGSDVRVVESFSRWLDLAVRMYADDTADVSIQHREELIYTEWIKRRCFLGIKFGVKERRQEIVSLNPNTEIISSEFITIRE